MTADFSREAGLIAAGKRRVVGIDEVGRGPWAGPVVIAGVIFDPENIPDNLADSKKLSPAKRAALAMKIKAVAEFQIVEISAEQIDKTNILAATLLGMRRVAEALNPDFALIDGNKIPDDLCCAAEAIVKGDGKSSSIAAASIVAKTYRDRLMADLSRDFPGYGWESNAGYGTNAHKIGLQNLGVTPHHRRSFKPIHNILWKDSQN
ncbi:MAG: ribonuclease HII [Pseudomonadota bacterium]